MELTYREIGDVIADEASPSFDLFRFKALSSEYVFPGTLVGTWISKSQFLIGRISASIEINPHESASRSKAREAMGIAPDYPDEAHSINIYRVYEAEIIEEGTITKDDKGEITNLVINAPSNMAKAGEKVFIPSEDVISKAMGFATDPNDSLVLGRTKITMENEEKPTNNVLLKKQIIQRHIFVGGTTGSGKSFSTGILLEELNKFQLPIVIMDSQHEYEELAKGLKGKVLVPGKDYKVRISSLSEGELLGLVPTLRGTLGYDLLAYSFIKLKREVYKGSREGFGLTELLSTMESEAPNLDLKPISIKAALLRTQSSIERHSFLGDQTNWIGLIKNTAVVNIDCGNLDQGQLQLIVGATLRELQGLRKGNKVPPYICVLDEAHLLVPSAEDSPCKQVIRENVRIGRHYGICMVLITQSPVDIDVKTIRQCNTRLIFALEPDQLEAIRGVKADASEDTLKRLPKMPVGTCLLSGTYETIKHAIPIQIRSDRKTESGGKTPDIFNEMRTQWQKK
jgi:DNA helicase HerA-like ATPase